MLAVLVPRFRLHLLLPFRPNPPPSPPMMASRYWAQEKRIARRDEVDHFVPQRSDHVDVEAPVPALDVALDQDDLGVRVRPDEVFGESHGGRIRAHGAAVAEQLIPVRPSEGLAMAAEFGVHGFVPHRAVPDVGEKLHGVVAGVAEDGKGGLHRCDGRLSGVRRNIGEGVAIHMVPVRGKPRLNTCIGTVRLRVRRSILESGRKSSGAVSRTVRRLEDMGSGRVRMSCGGRFG